MRLIRTLDPEPSWLLYGRWRGLLLAGLILVVGSVLFWSIALGQPREVTTLVQYGARLVLMIGLLLLAAVPVSLVVHRIPPLAAAPGRARLGLRSGSVAGDKTLTGEIVVFALIGLVIAATRLWQITDPVSGELVPPLPIPLLLLAAALLGVRGGIGVGAFFLIATVSIEGGAGRPFPSVPMPLAIAGLLATTTVGRLAERGWTRSLQGSVVVVIVGLVLIHLTQSLVAAEGPIVSGGDLGPTLDYLRTRLPQTIVALALAPVPFLVGRLPARGTSPGEPPPGA